MYIEYDDIVSRIAEPPLWWLEGVPRYEPFHHQALCVYAQEALLVHIRCQICSKDFEIGLYDPRPYSTPTFRALLNTRREIGVGDPPNACCFPGSSMGAVEVAVLQFWERPPNQREWRRVPELERGLWTSDEELVERHREAWRRIRSCEARPEGLLPAWTPLPIPPEFPRGLPQPVTGRQGRTRRIDAAELNARRRLALLALDGRITKHEHAMLEELGQLYFAPYEARPQGPRPSWAQPLAEDVRRIDEAVLAHAIDGYAEMTQEERDEHYCHGLDRKLHRLTSSGRLGQDERLSLYQLLISNYYSR